MIFNLFYFLVCGETTTSTHKSNHGKKAGEKTLEWWKKL